MPVLSGLGSGHVDDFAGTAFEEDKTVLAEGRTLDWVGEGCS